MDNLTEAILNLNDTLATPPPVDMSGWTMVGITVVYVIATIAICVFNFWSAKETKKQTSELKRQFDEINRPNIDVTHEIVRGGLLCLKIENTGKKLAQNVKLEIDDDFIVGAQGLLGNGNLIELKNSVLSLGIEQKWFVALCVPWEVSKMNTKLLKIDTSYADDRQTYTKHTTIDFSQYDWALMYDSPLGDISGYIKIISDKIRTGK